MRLLLLLVLLLLLLYMARRLTASLATGAAPPKAVRFSAIPDVRYFRPDSWQLFTSAAARSESAQR